MTHNFSISNELARSFILKHKSSDHKADSGFYESIFILMSEEFECEELLALFERLASYRILEEIPYTLTSTEIDELKNLIISDMDQEEVSKNILNLLTIFDTIQNKVAHLYLLSYIKNLTTLNETRIASISDLIEKNIITFYESHLIWLSKLARHIRDVEKVDFPQLDHTACAFGKWLSSNAKETIQSVEKYNNIFTIHKNLHLFATKIYDILGTGEYRAIITYLEKCEYISLNIGTELALLDQIIINKKVTKDALTGTLNRHALKNVFENQYELALASENSFILAMCDLDFFKKVNDNYGHIAGDKMLQLFASVAKKSLRSLDLIIRYGGEEFILILPTNSVQKAYSVLDNLRQEFEKTTLSFNGQEISTTVSIGMREISPTTTLSKHFVDEYIMTVDEALYKAKENGRNQVVIY